MPSIFKINALQFDALARNYSDPDHVSWLDFGPTNSGIVDVIVHYHNREQEGVMVGPTGSITTYRQPAREPVLR